MFVLATDLHKTIGEIRSMPARELVEWRAYYRYRAWEAAQAQKAAG
jgi:hypothetical protein